MNWGVQNCDFSGGNCYLNSQTLSESKSNNNIDFTNKRDENSSNWSGMKNTGLQDGFDIDVLLPVWTLHQYSNTEYNNQYH